MNTGFYCSCDCNYTLFLDGCETLSLTIWGKNAGCLCFRTYRKRQYGTVRNGTGRNYVMELHDLYCSLGIMWVIKSGRV